MGDAVKLAGAVKATDIRLQTNHYEEIQCEEAMLIRHCFVNDVKLQLAQEGPRRSADDSLQRVQRVINLTYLRLVKVSLNEISAKHFISARFRKPV